MEQDELIVINNNNNSSMLLFAKILAMFILGFGSLTLGMLPLIVGRYRINKRQKCSMSSSTSTPNSTATTIDNSTQGLLTSLLLCFGGGVLLFTTFLHLAPEVRISVEKHQSNGQLIKLGELSTAELLFCIGFFLVYFVEETVHAALAGKNETNEDLLYRTVSVRRCNNNISKSTTSLSGSTATITTVTTNKKPSSPTSWKSEKIHCENEQKDSDIKPNMKLSPSVEFKKNEILPVVFIRSTPSIESVEYGCEEDRFVPSKNPHPPESKSNQQQHQHHHHHSDTSVRGFLAVLALSFHAIFEGLAVGLEPSLNSVIYLAIAIATHKLVIAFCVGMELYVTGASTKTILGYLSIFAMVTPIGIIAGVALGYFKNDSENLGATPTILQGMAAGTLLYVVFFEVLARERANDKSGLLQLAAIITGFMLMLGLQIATSHSHSHSHGHGEEHGHSHSLEQEHEDHDHPSTGLLNNTMRILSATADILTQSPNLTTINKHE